MLLAQFRSERSHRTTWRFPKNVATSNLLERITRLNRLACATGFEAKFYYVRNQKFNGVRDVWIHCSSLLLKLLMVMFIVIISMT